MKEDYNKQLAELYRDMKQFKKAQRVEDCSTKTFIAENFNEETGEVTRSKVGAMRCHCGFCPICAETKTRYERYIAYQILPKILDTYKTLSMTITLEAGHISKAREQIAKLHEIFIKLVRSKWFKPFIHGYISHIEWSQIEDDHINLHLHAVLFVSGSILGRQWVSSLKLGDLIQQYGDLDYYPICKISKVGTTNTSKTVNYILKKQDIELDYVKILDEQLKHTRLFSYGGIYKHKRREFIDKLKKENKPNKDNNIILYSIDTDKAYNFIDFIL